MKSNTFFLILCMALPAKDYAQTLVERSIALQPGQSVEAEFDYPRLIRVSTWDKNEVVIRATGSINGGENDDAFLLQHNVDGKTVRISSTIRDIKNLPARVTVHRDGQKIVFRNREELRKYQAEHGKVYNYMSNGPDIDIEIEITVPRNTTTDIRSTYGIVEVENFSGPLTVDATYGGVDAALVEGAVGALSAETNFGNIYTNLDIDFKGERVSTEAFYTSVSAKPGSGPPYRFVSKFGNVYLRKGMK